MAEKRFAKNVSIILVISAGLTLFTYIFVGHHRDIPDRVRQERNALLSTGSSVVERIKAVGRINVASTETQRALVPVAAPEPVKVNGQQVYQSACIACHGSGIGGAPMISDAAAWAPRIAQGISVLRERAISGFQGSTGFMPPKGARVDLSDHEINDAVDYMVAEARK